MARHPRLQFEGGLYHVFSRGNRKEAIFGRSADYRRFEDFLMEAVRWSGIRLFAWCLMPNHFHLLLETPDAGLSYFMQRLLARYAQYFNWAHGLVGHVFQGRYKSIVCDKESYFLELIRYILLNPHKSKRITDPANWLWSSHRFYMGEQAPECIQQSIQEVLQRFGPDPVSARKRYAQFLADGLQQGNWKDFYKVRGDRYLGSEEFIVKVKKGVQEPVRHRIRRTTQAEQIEEIVKAVEQSLGIGQEELSSCSRQRNISRARQALVYVGRRHYRLPAVALARYLNKDVSAISQMLKRSWGKEEGWDELQRLKQTVGLI